MACALAALALHGSGCRPSPSAAEPGDVAEGGGFPVELVGADGVTVRIEAPPRRVVPTNAGAQDDLCVLIGPERVAALPRPVGAYATAGEIGADWDDVPRFEQYRAEPLLLFEPDLVVTHVWHEANSTAALRQAGVPVLVLPEADSLESIHAVLELLGRALGVPGRTAEVIADIDRRVAALEDSSGPRRAVRALGYTNYGTGGGSPGSGTTFDLMIELTGMRNAARELGLVGWQSLDFEQLLTLDPDLLVLGAAGDGARGDPTEQVLRGEPALAGLRAVREDRIVVLPSRLYTTNSHFLIEAAEELARRVDALLERLGAGE